MISLGELVGCVRFLNAPQLGRVPWCVGKRDAPTFYFPRYTALPAVWELLRESPPLEGAEDWTFLQLWGWPTDPLVHSLTAQGGKTRVSWSLCCIRQRSGRLGNWHPVVPAKAEFQAWIRHATPTLQKRSGSPLSRERHWGTELWVQASVGRVLLDVPRPALPLKTSNLQAPISKGGLEGG